MPKTLPPRVPPTDKRVHVGRCQLSPRSGSPCDKTAGCQPLSRVRQERDLWMRRQGHRNTPPETRDARRDHAARNVATAAKRSRDSQRIQASRDDLKRESASADKELSGISSY